MTARESAIVVGGGIIGCSIAYELTKRGFAVTLLDKGGLNEEASTAAAGMLGAHVEIHEDGPFYELCKESQRLYRPWTEELYELTGISPQYTPEGIVRAALTEDDESELRGRLPWIGCSWLSADEIRALEPALSPNVRGGLYFESDHQIHPLHLARSLQAALQLSGCRVMPWTPALGVIRENGRVCGVRCPQGPLYADRVIVTAGAWGGELLEGAGLKLPLFPVKGQCFAVRPASLPIRKTAFTQGCYIIPRQDGTLTIGATQLEVGFDKQPTAAGIAAVYAKAEALLPCVKDAAFLKTWAGLRPGTPDGLPYIGGVAGAPGLIVATGHYRNGILLAPVTAKLIGQLTSGETPSTDLAPYTPERVHAAQA